MIKILIKKAFLFVTFLVMNFVAAGQSSPVTYKQHSKQPPSANELMKWHEVFTYEVHYSFFTLGEVKVEVGSDTLYHHQKSWHLQAIITSNPGIPFVGKEENHYNSIFSIVNNQILTQEFWSDNVDENEYKTSHYTFDRDKGKVYGYEKEHKPDTTDTLTLEDPAISGPTIFFMNRPAAGTDSTLKIPIYLNLEKKYVTLRNTTKTEKREYDAFPEEVTTYYMEGETDVDGPFGFSGEFKAWYLADDLRVPVEARVKVWLGNVKIKLIKYTKERRK